MSREREQVQGGERGKTFREIISPDRVLYKIRLYICSTKTKDKMKKEELREKIAAHKKWLNGEGGGQRADLSYSDLSGSNLSGSDLRGLPN